MLTSASGPKRTCAPDVITSAPRGRPEKRNPYLLDGIGADIVVTGLLDGVTRRYMQGLRETDAGVQVGGHARSRRGVVGAKMSVKARVYIIVCIMMLAIMVAIPVHRAVVW